MLDPAEPQKLLTFTDDVDEMFMDDDDWGFNGFKPPETSDGEEGEFHFASKFNEFGKEQQFANANSIYSKVMQTTYIFL